MPAVVLLWTCPYQGNQKTTVFFLYEKNKIYGSKFHLNDYYIKAYDKTFQAQCKDKINIGKPYFRYEIEGKTKFFNNKTNNVGITTVADLIDKIKYKKLCDILINYDNCNLYQF